MSIDSGYPFLKYFLILLYFHMDIFVICIIIVYYSRAEKSRSAGKNSSGI